MFEGVYPKRTRCSVVDEPIVPPPPTTMTDVLDLTFAILPHKPVPLRISKPPDLKS